MKIICQGGKVGGAAGDPVEKHDGREVAAPLYIQNVVDRRDASLHKLALCSGHKAS